MRLRSQKTVLASSPIGMALHLQNDLAADQDMEVAVERVKDLLGTLSDEDRKKTIGELQKQLELRVLLDSKSSEEESLVRWTEFGNLVPEFLENWREVERRARLVPLPPNSKSAANIETIMMAQGYCLETITHLQNYSKHQSVRDAYLTLAEHLTLKSPVLEKLRRLLNEGFYPSAPEAIAAAHLFAVNWMRSGFAKLEIGHKLAASLALTDVHDDIEIKAPWPSWSLVVPPGLFGDPSDGDIARVWCEGTEPRFFISSSGSVMGPVTRAMIHRPSEPGEDGYGRAVAVAIDCLVRGACVALSNPDDYRKKQTSSSVSKSSKRDRHGAPDFSSARFMLNAPVTVDLRERLIDVLHSRNRGGGGSPKVQYLVRGHWRNQAHGPHHSLRKQIWVHPFWKGPEESRVLLRNYTVKS